MLRSCRARTVKVMLVLPGALGIVAAIGYVHHSKSVSRVPKAGPAVRTDAQPSDPAVGDESSLGKPLPLGGVFGCNSPAPPPIIMLVGPPPGDADGLDLSTPAAAVYCVLSLIDEAAIDRLAPCLLEETEEAVSSLYPRYLGHPVGLAEVIQDGESAEVFWEATVHTTFSRRGKHRLPGETITLTARLVQVEGLWKLLQLHDGDEDGSQEHGTSAN